MNELLESLSKLDVPATELEKVFTTLNLDYSEVIETLIHEASIYNALNPIRCVFNGVAIGMFAFFAFEVIFSFAEEKKEEKKYDVFTNESFKDYSIYTGIVVAIAAMINIAIPLLAPHYTLLLHLFDGFQGE